MLFSCGTRPSITSTSSSSLVRPAGRRVWVGLTSEELVMLGQIPHEKSLRCLSCLSGDLSYITWWVEVMDLGAQQGHCGPSGGDCDSPTSPN
ncbi:hypothetical protein RHMOL_Rhmol12G0099000 [Rhododendron molle]|uniref:Uncharacterized protein n=1 Tax=Rhododendron molle TaxID=49168 RepID=A0ACC0LHK5_RHOML|nr:hypothetical protein RHMOL_Rhmol12G0099000 [Rhododendron molle]